MDDEQSDTGDARKRPADGQAAGGQSDRATTDEGVTDGPTGDAGERGLLHSRLADTLDATDTIIWEADLEAGTIDHVGPVERVAGLDREEFSNPMKLNMAIVHPDDQLGVAKEFEQLLDGDTQQVDSEFRTSPENGQVRWLRTQASVEERVDGRVATVVGLSTDITPLKEREARLEEFAGIVSHDLRNPLSVATARLELAASEHDSDHLDHARGALDRMEVLIENLLTLARADEAAGDREPVALRSVASGAWETVDTAGATLAIETDHTVSADRTRLQQLLENLFRNAVEHGSASAGPGTRHDDAEHGEKSVTITVGDLDDGTGFYVADDGVGIPTEIREALFAGNTTDEHTGLGLRIVEQVADAHDWELRATESAEGGARFEVADVDFV